MQRSPVSPTACPLPTAPAGLSLLCLVEGVHRPRPARGGVDVHDGGPSAVQDFSLPSPAPCSEHYGVSFETLVDRLADRVLVPLQVNKHDAGMLVRYSCRVSGRCTPSRPRSPCHPRPLPRSPPSRPLRRPRSRRRRTHRSHRLGQPPWRSMELAHTRGGTERGIPRAGVVVHNNDRERNNGLTLLGCRNCREERLLLGSPNCSSTSTFASTPVAPIDGRRT
jgi:hypothetical protein